MCYFEFLEIICPFHLSRHASRGKPKLGNVLVLGSGKDQVHIGYVEEQIFVFWWTNLSYQICFVSNPIILPLVLSGSQEILLC